MTASRLKAGGTAPKMDARWPAGNSCSTGLGARAVDAARVPSAYSTPFWCTGNAPRHLIAGPHTAPELPEHPYSPYDRTLIGSHADRAPPTRRHCSHAHGRAIAKLWRQG